MKSSLLKVSFALAIISLYTFLFGIVNTIGEQAGYEPAVSVSQGYETTNSAEPPRTTIDVTNRRQPNFADYDPAPFPEVTTFVLETYIPITTIPTTSANAVTTIPATTRPFTLTTTSPTITTTTARPSTTTRPATTTTRPVTTTRPPATTTRVHNPSNETLRVRVRGNEIEGDAFDIVARTVQGEIGSRFHAEAVKAQAVAVYTFIRYQNANGVVPNLPVAATATDRIRDLTREVFGELIYHNGRIINSVFSASSAGFTSSARNVWGSDVVYLQSIRTDFDIEHNDPNIDRTVTYTAAEIRDAVSRQTGIQLTGNPANWFRIINHVDTVYVGQMTVGGQTTFMNNNREIAITGRVFRERIMGFGIDGRLFRSASFTFEYDAPSDSFTFTFRGYGHGVGMSQNGANILATHRGLNYRQILQHYYIGVEVR